MCSRFFAVLPSGTRSHPMAGTDAVGVDDRGAVRVVVPGLGHVVEGERPERRQGVGVVRVAAQGPVLGHDRTVEAIPVGKRPWTPRPGPVMVDACDEGRRPCWPRRSPSCRSAGSAPRRAARPSGSAASSSGRAASWPAHSAARSRETLGARPPGRRHGRGRLRVPAGEPTPRGRRSARWSRTRAAPATARPAPGRRTRRCTAHCSSAATCCSSTNEGTGRSEPINCPQLQDLKIDVRRRGCGLRRPARRAGRRLHDSALGRRPGGGHRGPGADEGRRVRRLVRHVLRAGVRGPAPRAGAHRGARRVLPDLRRDRLVPDPGTGGPARLRRGVRPVRRLPVGGAGIPAEPAPGAWRRYGERPWRGQAYDADGRRDHRDRRRSGPGHGRVRRDVHAGLLPRADRRPAVRAGRRPRAAAAAGGGGDRRRHRRRPGGGVTARAWTRRWRATTTRSCTT